MDIKEQTQNAHKLTNLHTVHAGSSMILDVDELVNLL